MKKTISILLAACAALTSCESFLDREPVAEVGSGCLLYTSDAADE